MFLNRFVLGISSVLLSCLIVSCSDSTSSTSLSQKDYSKIYPPANGGTMIDAMTGEPSGLIAMIAGESAASAIAGNIFNSLLKYDRNLDLTGELAESWEISKDKKTITFHLKPGLKWA